MGVLQPSAAAQNRLPRSSGAACLSLSLSHRCHRLFNVTAYLAPTFGQCRRADYDLCEWSKRQRRRTTARPETSTSTVHHQIGGHFQRRRPTDRRAWRGRRRLSSLARRLSAFLGGKKKSAKGELNHPLKSGDIEIFLWVDEPIFRLYHSISWRVALLARRIGVISHSGGDPRRTARFSIQTGHLHSNIQTLY